MLLDVTVVIPYYNENDSILTTLDLISLQTILPNEVIFVNSTSSDETSNTINDWIKNLDNFQALKAWKETMKTRQPECQTMALKHI